MLHPSDPATVSSHVDEAIRRRVTTKVFSSEPQPECGTRETIEELISAAGWAPFHRPCQTEHQIAGGLSGIVPWRMYALDAAACRKLRTLLPEEASGKMPSMLAAADALVQVTWLPNLQSEDFKAAKGQLFEPTLANMEHIAAASAAIQNFLIAATARGIRSYWSSGGAHLRDARQQELLGIPSGEILLGAIFLFPSETGDLKVVGSKLRQERPEKSKWSRWVEL